jgi:hypothetical protein
MSVEAQLRASIPTKHTMSKYKLSITAILPSSNHVARSRIPLLRKEYLCSLESAPTLCLYLYNDLTTLPGLSYGAFSLLPIVEDSLCVP